MIHQNVPASPLRRTLHLSTLALALGLAACSHPSDAQVAAPQAPGSAAPPATVMVAPSPSAAPTVAAPAAAAPAEPAPVVLKDAGFMAPESARDYGIIDEVYAIESASLIAQAHDAGLAGGEGSKAAEEATDGPEPSESPKKSKD